MSEEIVKYHGSPVPQMLQQGIAIPTTLTEIQGYAKLFAESGFFTDTKQMAQAAVKIIAGAEVGIKPFAALTGIHIVQGKPVMGADLLASLVKRSGRYDYRVREMTTERCKIEFFECGEPIGLSDFSIGDAKLAGLLGNPTWTKYPRNMLFARAMSNGVAWYCSDVTAGRTYTPDELDAPVDSEGNYKPTVLPRQEPIIVEQEPHIHTTELTAEQMDADVVDVPPLDPFALAFHQHMVESMVAAWKEGKIVPTLKNVSDALAITPERAESLYWATKGDKSHFVPNRCSDSDLLKLGHYAKTYKPMDTEQNAAVADTLAEIRRVWEEKQKEASGE